MVFWLPAERLRPLLALEVPLLSGIILVPVLADLVLELPGDEDGEGLRPPLRLLVLAGAERAHELGRQRPIVPPEAQYN